MKNRQTLPKQLPGAVCAQWVKCGRAWCRCARGEGLHGPYYYRFFRDASTHRLHKEYVPLADLKRVRAACDRRRELERTVRQEHRDYRALFKALNRQLKALGL